MKVRHSGATVKVRARAKKFNFIIDRSSRGSTSLDAVPRFFMRKFATVTTIIVLLFAIAIISYIFITNPFAQSKFKDRSDAVIDETADTIINEQEEVLENTEVFVQAEFRVNDTLYPISVSEDINGYELMNVIATENDDFTFSGSESEFGFFVEEINDTPNNPGNNDYWSLYINDELSTVGISDYIVQNNDVVEWRFENVEF